MCSSLATIRTSDGYRLRSVSRVGLSLSRGLSVICVLLLGCSGNEFSNSEGVASIEGETENELTSSPGGDTSASPGIPAPPENPTSGTTLAQQDAGSPELGPIDEGSVEPASSDSDAATPEPPENPGPPEIPEPPEPVDPLAEVAVALDGARIDIPCDNGVNGPFTTRFCDIAPDLEQQSISLTIAGDPERLYSITLQIRGLSEVIAYVDGKERAGNVYEGGRAPDNQLNWNAFQLTFSDPPTWYFLNHRDPKLSDAQVFDYQHAFTARGGSTVSFELNGANLKVNGLQFANQHQLTVQSDHVGPQPYDGQFLQLNVMAVTEL